MTPKLPSAIIAAALALATAGTAVGQVPIRSRAAEITLTGRLHTQFNTSSVAGTDFSEFLVRRARATIDVKLSDFISGRVQPEFGEGSASLRDGYMQLTFDPSFTVKLGQFKRPFDLFELTSSTQILVVERAGGIRGVDDCAGPGGICSLSRITEKLGYSDRDVGMIVEGATGKAEYAFSITNGVGANLADENGAKSYTGRVGVAASENVTIAGNLGIHDYVNTVTGGDDYAVAAGADVEVGNYTEGFHLQAGVVTGQNWSNLNGLGDASNFLTFQVIASNKLVVQDNAFVSHLEPMGRISWGDPDRDTADDGGLLLTPGLMVHFLGRNKIAANIDIYLPATGDTEWSLKLQSYLHY